MNVEYDLVIDFARPSKSNTIIISEGDSNSRLCRFVLLSNKQAFDMLDVSTATVKGIKSDGSVIYGDGTIEKDDDGNNINEVTYTLPAAVSDITGKTTMTITLMSVRGEVITSFEFYVQTRNSLYSEDDYISDSDLSGFRDLLNRSNAALEKMEHMTQAEALPNPYPLNVYTNNNEYHYSGTEAVDIELGNMAYIADDPVIETNAVDETAAGIAVSAASEARLYAEQAASSAHGAATSKSEVETMAIDVASQSAGASEAALNASRSAVVANEAAESATNTKKNIDKIIDDKVTTITTQLAGDMIDDIIDDAKGLRDQAAASAVQSASSATAASGSAADAQRIASSIRVGATQILSSGVHIADLNVNGVVTELYAPTADQGSTAASGVTYSHTASGLVADNVQDAIDELNTNVTEVDGNVSDLATSVTNVETNVSDLETRIDNLKTGGSNITIIGEEEYEGKTVSLATSKTVYTSQFENGVAEFTGVLEVGAMVVSTDDDFMDIVVEYYGNYTFEFSSFNFNDWLASADITAPYESLEEVLADENALRILFNKHASVDYLLAWSEDDQDTTDDILEHDLVAKWVNRSDYALDTLYQGTYTKPIMVQCGKYGYGEWAEAEKALVPALTSATGSNGEVFASGSYDRYVPYYAFNGKNDSETECWIVRTATGYIGYKFNTPQNVSKIYLANRHNSGANGSVRTFKVEASNDGTNWVSSGILTNPSDQADAGTYFNTGIDGNYTYWRINVLTTTATSPVQIIIGQLQFYAMVWGPKGNVPVMTSNTSPYGQVFGSDNYASYDKYRAFNGESGLNDGYLTAANTTNNLLGYKFINPVNVNQVGLELVSNGNNISIQQTIDIEASNDNSTWTKLKESVDVSVNSASRKRFDIPIDNNSYFIYYRIKLANKMYDSGSLVWFVRTLQFYGRELSVSVPKMTSNTTPTGQCVFNGTLATNHEAYRAFDKNDNTDYASQSGVTKNYIGYKFPNKVSIRMAYIKAYSSSHRYNFAIHSSDDGENWSDNLATGTAHESGKCYPVAENGEHEYWRVYIGTNVDTNNTREIDFFGLDYSENTDVIVYSAANDTVYYYDGGTKVPLCVTDLTGKGRANVSSIPSNTVLYSTIAKSTSNTSNAFTKELGKCIGDDGNVYFMPEGALYWYGNMCEWLTGGYSVNGWGTSNSYEVNDPTWSTNSAYMSAPNGAYYALVPVKAVDVTNYNSLKANITNTNGTDSYRSFGCVSTKVLPQSGTSLTTGINTLNISSTTGNQYCVCYTVNGNRSATISALWLE